MTDDPRSIRLHSSASLPTAPGYAIELRDVWKVYSEHPEQALATIMAEGLGKGQALARFGAVVAVRGVSLGIAEGEIFCVMGLSGSGKSTLVRHINRLIEPTAGSVYVNGVDVGGLDPQALRQLRSTTIGMVFQNMALLPHRSVRDNIAFALELRNVDEYTRAQLADRMMETVGLQSYGDRMPSELSGGMQQRVGLARALAADPAILLMDEPFSALDPLIRRGLQDEFLTLSRAMRKTTVFITHDLDEAIRMGSRIAIMKDGVIVQIGTPEEIVMQPIDAYVADFVRGISKLKLMSALSVMTPIAQYKQQMNGSIKLDAYPTAGPADTLEALIGLAIDHPEPTVIVEGGTPIGVVTKDALLRGIRGRA